MIAYEQPRQTLPAFSTALASVASNPLTVLVLGDSVTERLHANRRDLAWPTRMLAGLRSAAQPAGVPGGAGFIPAWNLDTAFFNYPQTWVSTAGVGAAGGSIGVGCRASTIPVGGSQTIPLDPTNTSADLFWYRSPAGGTLTWLVTFTGATGTASFTTAGTAGGGHATRIGTTAAGKVPVSLTVTASVAPVIFEGAFFYRGDETAGIRLAEGGHTGATASGTFPAGAPWLDSVATIQPALVVIEMGINDWNGGVTAAAYAAAVSTLIANIRARCTVRPSILLVGYWQAFFHGTEVDTWQAYIAALQGLVSGPGDIRLLDLYNTCVDDQNRSQYQLYPVDRDTQRFADIVHPSDWGHQAIANMVVSTLVTPAEAPGNPVPPQQLLIALQNGPLDDHSVFLVDAPGVPPKPGHWTDVSGYVEHTDGNRGRQQQTGNFEAGKRTWELNNDNGEFNTFSQSGLFSPYLDLGRPVKHRTTVGGYTSDRFTGHLISCKPLWPDVMSTKAELQADDLFRHLNLTRLGSNAYGQLLSSMGFTDWWRCNEAGSTPGYLGTVNLANSLKPANGAVVTPGNPGVTVLSGGPGPLLAQGDSSSISLPYGALGGVPYVSPVGLATTPPSATFVLWVGGIQQGRGSSIFFNTFAPSPNSFDIYIDPAVNAGLLQYKVWDNSGSLQSRQGVNQVADGGPHMLAMVWTAAGVVFYVDGRQDAIVVTTMGNWPAANLLAVAFLSGSVPDAGGFWVSEMAASPTARSPSDIGALRSVALGYPQQGADQRVAAGLATVGVSANLQQLDPAVQQVQQNTVNLVKTSALAHLQQVEQTEEGALFVTGSGIVRFVSRQTLATKSPHAAVMATFGDRVNHPAAIPGFKWGDANVWDKAVWGAPATMKWGDANAWDVEAWGVSDISFQPGPDIGLDDQNIVNEPDVTRVGGLTQAFYGSSPFGPHALSRSSVLHLTEACSLEHAKWLLNKYSGSRTELRTIVVRLTEYLSDPEALRRILQLDLLHRVEVIRSKVGFRQVGLIEHMAETVTAEEWTLTLSVAVADTYPTWSWADTQ